MRDGDAFYLDGGVNYKSMCIYQISCVGMPKTYACNEYKTFSSKKAVYK